jgi:hypothetical protein
MIDDLEKKITTYLNDMPASSRVNLSDIVDSLMLTIKNSYSRRVVEACVYEVVDKRGDVVLQKGKGICKSAAVDKAKKTSLLPGAIGVIIKPLSVEDVIQEYLNSMPDKSRVTMNELVDVVRFRTDAARSKKVIQAFILEAIETRSDICQQKGLGICKKETRK